MPFLVINEVPCHGVQGRKFLIFGDFYIIKEQLGNELLFLLFRFKNRYKNGLARRIKRPPDWKSLLWLSPESKAEYTSNSGSTFYGDRPLMGFNDMFADGKSQPCSAR